MTNYFMIICYQDTKIGQNWLSSERRKLGAVVPDY